MENSASINKAGYIAKNSIADDLYARVKALYTDMSYVWGNCNDIEKWDTWEEICRNWNLIRELFTRVALCVEYCSEQIKAELKLVCTSEEKKAAAEGKKLPELSWREKRMPVELTPLSVQETPSYLYNAKIAPIAGYSARGVVWYQGEGDSGGASLKDFQAQFTRLIESWRAAWGDDKLYFLFVQLASYDTKAEWPDTRWAQYRTMLAVARTGMANIIDCGDEKDIHPKDKTTVGIRLANIALRDVYCDHKVHPYGPMFKMIRYGDKGAEVVFNLDGRKLVGKGDGRGFEVLAGGKWIAAKAELCGNRVFVNPADGSNAKIEGVRYLWKNWARPDVWLYNQDGLPALSFISVR